MSLIGQSDLRTRVPRPEPDRAPTVVRRGTCGHVVNSHQRHLPDGRLLCCACEDRERAATLPPVAKVAPHRDLGWLVVEYRRQEAEREAAAIAAADVAVEGALEIRAGWILDAIAAAYAHGEAAGAVKALLRLNGGR